MSTKNFIELLFIFAQLQKQNLKDYQGKVFWHDDIQDVPKKTTFFIANEFFNVTWLRNVFLI